MSIKEVLKSVFFTWMLMRPKNERISTHGFSPATEITAGFIEK
jgi:hypothetical protein